MVQTVLFSLNPHMKRRADFVADHHKREEKI